MRPSLTSLKSNRPGGASIALLAALLALGGGAQALAPAPAAAMIDLGDECGGTVTTDPSYCDENGGGGGGYEQPGETIVIRDPVLPVPDGLPHEIGGRRQARADGPRIPFRSRHGGRPVRRVAELPLTRDECLTLKRGWDPLYGLIPGFAVLGSDVIANRLNIEIMRTTDQMFSAQGALERLRSKKAELLKALGAESHPGEGERSKILDLEKQLVELNGVIAAREQKSDSLKRLLSGKYDRLQRLVEANGIAHRTLRAECKRKYPELFEE